MSPQAEGRLCLQVDGQSGPPVELPRAGVLTVGSAPGKADLVLSGEGVAAVHCAIGRVKGAAGWALKDLGAAPGTLVNGERVETIKLGAGDQIVIGSRRLRVVDPEKPAAPPAAGARGASAALPLARGYRVERPLGRGGMGQVFLAVQESLQRKVALKVLAERLAADADFVRRFQAEARAAAALNHPNVVTVHDVWEEDGRHLLAMEYMERGTLEARLTEVGRLPWREVLDILVDAAKGLLYAELRGIVHRDIKPANLMQNEVGTTKIADLGLATHLEAEASLEAGGKIFGTPHFISPEQARGERVDGRSDLYSLGATAYRLLSGRTPFEGATTREILRGHFFERPEPLAELVPDLPADLARAIERNLEKRPEDRYPSAGQLLQDLERIKSHLVHGVGAAEGAPRRSRGLTWVGLALLFAAGLAFLWRERLVAGTGGGEREPGSLTQVPDPAGAPASDGSEPAQGRPGSQDSNSASEPVRDEDGALEQLEASAERAYQALPADLTSAERRDELFRLSREFAGTTWSARATSEAVALERALAEATGLETDRARSLEEAAERLSAASAGPARPLAETLRAMLAVPVDPRLFENPEFQRRWLASFGAVFAGALETAGAAVARADALAAGGGFAELERELSSAFDALSEQGWPELPSALNAGSVPELSSLRSLRARLEARLAGLHEERRTFELEIARRDRRALTDALGGASGLERELRELDLAAAGERLAPLEQSLPLEESRRWVASLRADLSVGAAALRALAGEWSRGGWKRKTLDDPRGRGRAKAEAVGVEPGGILVKGGAGAELLPWSAFGDHPPELHQLFLERLPRPYTPAERAGIEALLRNAAVLRAIEEGAEMLHADEQRQLSDEEARAMLAPFELARAWSAPGSSDGTLAREQEATELLLSALRATSDERWSSACAALERLLRDYRATLLVRLLSDGRVLPELERALSAPAAAARAEDPPASEDQ